jgi:hypothetical protein
MSYFADLTPYTYRLSEEAPDKVNVGWLDKEHPFPIGDSNQDFQLALGSLSQNRVNQMRGIHLCDFCCGKNRPGSSPEIRVQGPHKVYAAPLLIHQYVTVHRYLPPQEFIDAVIASVRIRADDRNRSESNG